MVQNEWVLFLDIRQNFHTAIWFLRRNVRTAKFTYGETSYGEISSRRNFLTAKFPYGEISLRRNILRRNFLRRNILRRNFLAPGFVMKNNGWFSFFSINTKKTCFSHYLGELIVKSCEKNDNFFKNPQGRLLSKTYIHSQHWTFKRPTFHSLLALMSWCTKI